MTLEAQKTQPAGWYTDPMRSDGKRWWDGSQWTEHVRDYGRPARPATTAKPNPYGLQGVVSVPRAPLTDEEIEARSIRDVAPRPNNNLSWLALLFGVMAVGFTLLASLPVSQTAWVAGATVAAMVVGIGALIRRRSGLATNGLAPVVGILLGVVATVTMLLGVNILSAVESITQLGSTPTASQSPIASVPTSNPVPLVFPNNAQLTADETATQSLATAINRAYAGGQASLKAGQAWPATLRMSGSAVLTPSGSALVTLPAGMAATYQLASNGASYHIAVHGTSLVELATYDSGANGFSWSCLANDTSCVPTN